MAKKFTLKAPGCLIDYGARKHKLSMHIDPSPKGFLARSKATKTPVTVTIRPGGENAAISPIVLNARVKSVTLKLEDVTLQDGDRLRDVIYLVNDDKNVVDLVFDADPDSGLFEGNGDGDGDEE